MTTPFGFFDLLETFPKPGCALCRLLQRDVERFLDTLLYEHTVDPASQNNFRASRGLCHDHTWLLTRSNNSLAVAILYDAVLDEVMRISERTSPERQGGLTRLFSNGASSALAEALEPQKPCPACEVRDGAERRYLEALGEYANDERLRSAFEASDGLCLPHFRKALPLARDGRNARLLLEIQQRKWTALKVELQEFLHKMDAHYHEAMGAEATSWLRAMARMSGEEGYE